MELPDNVHLSPWLPQNELLADSRVTVFLTHGGLASVMELALLGKPAVVVPIFADQGRNAQMLSRHGGAAVLQKTDLKDWELVAKTIKDVLSKPKYKSNAQKLAEMLNNQPTNAKEVLVKHVEFAARFGKLPSLDNYGRRQSLIEYYFLDVIGILLMITVSICVFVWNIVRKLMNACRGEKVKKE